MSLLEKYCPNNLNKVVGNRKSIEYIREWLFNFYNAKYFLKEHNLLKKSTKGRKKKIDNLTPQEEEFQKMKSCLVVTGPHGCGKTSIINLLLEHLEIINLNELCSNTTIDSNLIKNIFINSKINNYVILVDDWESITKASDKKGIVEIIKYNNYKRWMPMVIISNNKHDKQITSIKKCSNEIKIYYPFSNEISRWINNIVKTENINIKYNLIDEIIEYCQNDMRRILIFVNELYINYKNTYINDEIFNTLKSSMGQTNQTLDLFKATEKLLSGYENLNECVDLYKIDKTVVPLMIFENYHKYTSKNDIIMDRISRSDVFESYIHCEQNYDLQDIHGLISCGILSYYINKHTNSKQNLKLIYATDLNKASVMRMNKKNKAF